MFCFGKAFTGNIKLILTFTQLLPLVYKIPIVVLRYILKCNNFLTKGMFVKPGTTFLAQFSCQSICLSVWHFAGRVRDLVKKRIWNIPVCSFSKSLCCRYALCIVNIKIISGLFCWGKFMLMKCTELLVFLPGYWRMCSAVQSSKACSFATVIISQIQGFASINCTGLLFCIR